jgi:hypothetical protein
MNANASKRKFVVLAIADSKPCDIQHKTHLGPL